MANWRPQDLKRQLAAARQNGVYDAAATSAEKHGLPLAVWLAVGSRESGLKNISGDSGHGRGPWQLDDRSHIIPEGLAALADACAAVLQHGLRQAELHGLTGDAALKVALSSYNAGFGNAWAGHLQGNSDLRTTGGEYAKDTMARAEAFRALLAG